MEQDLVAMLTTSKKACWLGAAYALTFAMTPSILADCEATETDQTSASDGVFGISFGASTEIDGNRAIVGAPDANGQSGSVYVYEFDGLTWNEYPKLLASDTQAGDQCGFSVAISGDVAVVGAPYHTHTEFWQGAVYVFRFDGKGWTQEQELLASNAGSGHWFGWSVAIDGNAIVVGAFNANGMGAAYVFRYDASTWSEEDILTASVPVSNDRFGLSVDIDANTILVGAPRDDDSAPDSGSVYVFSWQGGMQPWGDGVKVTASDPGAGNMLGTSLALSGDVAIVAANNDETGVDTGAAYLFRRVGATWIEEQKLIAPQGTPDPSEFAFDVAVEGDVALVGSVFDDAATTSTGSAYVYFFDGSSWAEQAKLTAANGIAGDLHGWSIALSGGIAVVGASGVDTSGGAAYTYDGLTDGMPDQCQAVTCPWDLDDDQNVGITDFLALLGAWGTDPGGPPDFDGDLDVGINDFLVLLGNWGACP